ncbi:MAG: copper resistance protein CopC [Actinomycetes bacterium]
MRARRQILPLLAVVATGLLLPVAATAHAYLVRTTPSASGTVDQPPRAVTLTFDEAVEPRFALISVTDAAGHQQTSGSLHRAATNPNTLVVPLQRVSEGWYLVYWRAISADGHPVRGFFTFAVGPNPGPAPQFVVPSIAETAATPQLVAARWFVFLAVMGAIGLFTLRIAIARPIARRVEGATLGALDRAFGVTAAVGLLAIPLYLLVATAAFALRSAFDLAAVVPLLHASEFGRGYVDLEICFALFVAAAAVALWVDRPARARRSVAEILSVVGAFGAAATVLLVPGAAGHAAQTSPRVISLVLDWLHLASGSVWLGGLVGLVVVARGVPAPTRAAALAVCVPRFSAVALGSVAVLLGSGIWATVNHMPTWSALWQTAYGQSILVKTALLVGAIALAAVNLLRLRPRLAASVGDRAGSEVPARLLLRLVGGEIALVVSAVLGAAVLSSLPPPPRSLALEGGALARVGPGPVTHVVSVGGYTLDLHVTPNQAAALNTFSLNVTRKGVPLTGAAVTATFVMLDMSMGNQVYLLDETSPGIYARDVAALVMVGHWGLSFQITPAGGEPVTAFIVDHATG